jgi:hypothetical protein
MGQPSQLPPSRPPEAEPGGANVKNRDYFGPAVLDKSPGDHSRGNRPLALRPRPMPGAWLGTATMRPIGARLFGEI